MRAKINNTNPIRLDLRPEYQVKLKEDNLVIRPSNNSSLPSSKIDDLNKGHVRDRTMSLMIFFLSDYTIFFALGCLGMIFKL